jgi:hypothetical protein
MKRYLTHLIYSCALLLVVSACSKDEAGPTAEEKFLADLEGTWQVSDVTLDNEDVSEEFDGMAVSFSEEQTFTVTNPVGNIWPATGLFELQETTGDLFDLMRDDEVVMSVDELTDNSLVISFEFDSAPGRLKGLAGEYTFTFTK